MNATVYLEGVGFTAPGCPDWPSAAAVLRGECAYVSAELPMYQPASLPPNERRRASAAVRMAFRVAEATTQAAAGIGRPAVAEFATVFSSADGDLGIAQRICMALTELQRQLSPTDFHNSVHNAPAGYWSIASQAKGPSSSLAAGDDSFAAGLLEAVSMAAVERLPTLMVCQDVPAPPPLLAKRPVPFAMGVALLLSPSKTPHSLASLRLAIATNVDDVASITALDDYFATHPAGRALPLLALLANRQSGRAVLKRSTMSAITASIEIQGVSTVSRASASKAPSNTHLT